MKFLLLIGWIYSLIALNVYGQSDHSHTPLVFQLLFSDISNLSGIFFTESKGEKQEAAQQYMAFTSSVDQFILIENGMERRIKSERMDETLFEFESLNPATTYIRLEDADCDNPPSILLWRQDDGKSTEWIHAEHGEVISIDSCFIKYSDKWTFMKTANTILEFLSGIFQKVRTGRISCGPTPTLKGGESHGKNEVSLVFEETDYSYYLDWDDFSVRFNVFETNPVTGLYIISHSGELIFCAGDTRPVERAFDLSGVEISALNTVVNEKLIKDKKQISYELNSATIRSNLLGEIKKEKWYELGIHVEGDSLDYIFNFQFLTNEDKTYFETFVSND